MNTLQEKINNFTEEGAKLALLGCLDVMFDKIHCKNCSRAIATRDGRLVSCGIDKECRLHWLNEAVNVATNNYGGDFHWKQIEKMLSNQH